MSLAVTMGHATHVAADILRANVATSCRVTSDMDPPGLATCRAFAFALVHNTSLSSLCLQNPGPSLAIFCAEALRHNRTLQHLCWQGTLGSEQAVIMIANTLKLNVTLSSLELRLTDGRLDEICGIALADMLCCNSSLEYFAMTFDDGYVGDRTCLRIAEALAQNTTLRTFKMEYSDMSVETAALMVKALANNTSLQELVIGSDTIDDQMGIMMAGMLKRNVSLKKFQLFGNALGDETGLAMVNTLKTNMVLESFILSGGEDIITECNMSEAVVGAMQDVLLQQNVTLRRFFAGRYMEDWAADEALERNERLPREWRKLAQLARVVHNTGFHSLKELHFRQQVFKFFLPPLCTVSPCANGTLGLSDFEVCAKSEATKTEMCHA